MSKENLPSKLRLLGSPVNLSYRDKKKDEKKNRNRPRSALQNSCFTPDYQERYRRPYSADAKTRSSNKSNLLKAFSIEVIPCNPPPKQLKVVPPTTDILEYSKSLGNLSRADKELCSNASDYGSEDTFVSLGTKIKARAQSNHKNKYQPNKNHLKYRNIAKKDKRMNNENISLEAKSEHETNDYDMEIKITEKQNQDYHLENINDNPYECRTSSPFKKSSYDSYFKLLHENNGTSSFSSLKHNTMAEPLDNDVDSLDFYSRQLKLNKQLSLVEEESTQDFSSLSPVNSVENVAQDTEKYNTASENKNEDYKILSKNVLTDTASYDVRNYNSFLNDFKKHDNEPNKHNLLSLSSTNVEVSSKDSGYTDSGSNDEKPFKRPVSLPNSISLLKQKYLGDDNSKSLGFRSNAYYNTYPIDNSKYERNETINHSRLLYKDFFLRKEPNGPDPPQNSPSKSIANINIDEEVKTYENCTEVKQVEYPTYLLNSTTKAYTSKVLEDYKKEIAAINNLHELTLKDIKSDAISPTPLNIDKMFEDNSGEFATDSNSNSQEDSLSINNYPKEPIISKGIVKAKDDTKINIDKEKDVTKISTKELIDDYLKVKENLYHKEPVTKRLGKYDCKVKKKNKENDSYFTHKNIPPKISMPLLKEIKASNSNSLSARIDLVENDKDIDSWISLTISSPRFEHIDHIENEINGKDDKPNGIKNVNNDISSPKNETEIKEVSTIDKAKELDSNATVLDIYSMLKEIESYGETAVAVEKEETVQLPDKAKTNSTEPKDNFTEIFEFLEKVEQSANEALSVVTNTTPQSIPKLECLLRLPQTELAQRLVTASLQLEERSCCIALLQESLTNHKQQMVAKVSALEKQSVRNISKVKLECEEAIKRHQNFIDQLINDKKTLNHRIEQLVDERRTLEERWKRQVQNLEERYKLELKNQHDRMAAAQQLARQRWVRQKAEKIKELTVKGLEGELRDMADRQQKEISDLKMSHAEVLGKMQARHAEDLETIRRTLGDEKEAALLRERQLASSRMEKQILELELTYQEQRTRLIAEMRAENERVAAGLTEKENITRVEIEKWREEQEKIIAQKKIELENDMARQKILMEEEINKKKEQLQEEFESHKRKYEADQHSLFKKREKEMSAQFKQERDKEIEKAIESMESEAQAGRREMQEALKRNKEQYEIELKELAQTEQATLRRYQDAQARVRHTEGKCADLEVTISQLETRNRLLTEKTNQLEQQASEIRSSCEEAWRMKVDALRREMEDAKKTHDEHMHQLYAKVKIAVARKDSAIQALTRETNKGQEKIAVLEQKLQQQRKDFLKHK